MLYVWLAWAAAEPPNERHVTSCLYNWPHYLLPSISLYVTVSNSPPPPSLFLLLPPFLVSSFLFLFSFLSLTFLTPFFHYLFPFTFFTTFLPSSLTFSIHFFYPFSAIVSSISLFIFNPFPCLANSFYSISFILIFTCCISYLFIHLILTAPKPAKHRAYSLLHSLFGFYISCFLLSLILISLSLSSFTSLPLFSTLISPAFFIFFFPLLQPSPFHTCVCNFNTIRKPLFFLPTSPFLLTIPCVFFFWPKHSICL